MQDELRQKFEEIAISAPKDGIGNAEGMMNYITGLMQAAYNLAVDEQSSNIESVEQAANIFATTYIGEDDFLSREDLYKAWMACYGWQKHQSNQEVVGWIKVSDKLPEPNVRVRAIRQFGNGKQEEIHTHYVERTQCFDDLMTDIITHWQPIILPKN